MFIYIYIYIFVLFVRVYSPEGICERARCRILFFCEVCAYIIPRSRRCVLRHYGNRDERNIMIMLKMRG